MRPSITPSEILEKRLVILKTLLGPGWLGPAWSDSRSRGDPPTWSSMECCYNRMVHWLLPGLRRVCNPGGHVPPPSTPDRTWNDPLLASVDVPAALLHGLRTGWLVSPAGVETSCRVAAADLLLGLVPLLAWLYCLHDKRLQIASSPLTRCLVLLAGIPGAGKSVIAGLVERFSVLIKGLPQIQSIGMDGWHLPNRVIQARTMTDQSGRIVPLADRKGSPDSFDARGMTADLESLVLKDQPARLPLYDRSGHEPIAEAVLVGAPIVLLEGNYLLLQAQGWERVADLACGAVWLDVPPDLAQRSMAERHIAVGRTRQQADSKWAANDWPNALVAMRGRPNADAIIYVSAARRLQFVHRHDAPSVPNPL